jgi:hypothetical protein
LLVADVLAQVDGDGLAAVLLRQQRQLDAARRGQRGALHDVGLARLEVFRAQGRGLRLEVLQQAFHAGRRRDHGALRRVVREEGAGDAVVALEVAFPMPRHLLRRDLVDAVAADEEQAPVAQRDHFRQRHADLLRIVQAALDAFR